MTNVEVTRTYLQMLTRDELRSAGRPDDPLQVAERRPCPTATYRSLYGEVGREYHWIDRRNWSDAEIRVHLDRDEISIWVLEAGTETAGFFELVGHEDGSVEIAYFGLLSRFLGKGYGKFLLTEATERAWEMHPNRVWLHTCTLDHPAALPNYLARGFQEFRRETYLVTID